MKHWEVAAGYRRDRVEHQTAFALRALISNVPTISHWVSRSCESFSTFCGGHVPALTFKYISIWIKFTLNKDTVAIQLSTKRKSLGKKKTEVQSLFQQGVYYNVAWILSWCKSWYLICGTTVYVQRITDHMHGHIPAPETIPLTYFVLHWQTLVTRVFSKVVTLIHTVIEHEFTEPDCSNVLVFQGRCHNFPSGCCQFPFFILAMHSLIVSIYLSACYWTFSHFLFLQSFSWMQYLKVDPSGLSLKGLNDIKLTDWKVCDT